MDTQPVILQQERIDDVPLLLGMLRRMGIAENVDKHLGRHHLHQGLSNGELLVGWLAYVLSESDHRKSPVELWAIRHQKTLETFFGKPLRPHEFSDDRLGILLKNLAASDWDGLEGDLFISCFEIYALPTHTIHLDTTATCGFHTTTDDGLMQLGHSKDHRPDLPQLKIMAAVTQPLNFPVATAIVPGNQADDVLYWQIVLRVKEKIPQKGLLFVGDCKMASLDVRLRVAQADDYYLTPLPKNRGNAQEWPAWLDAAVEKASTGGLTTIYKATQEGQEPEAIARGYEFTRTLIGDVDGQSVTLLERVQVVQSFARQESQKTKIRKGLERAEQELAGLTVGGKGRKVFRREEDLQAAIAPIEQEHKVAGLLRITIRKEVEHKKKYGKPGRPTEGAVALLEEDARYRIERVERDGEAIGKREEREGWRVVVSNAPVERLSLEASVLTYREGGGTERAFHQLKDAPLGIRPLFVRTDDQLTGLTRLLLIALRVLTLVEIVVRAKLAETGEALPDLYEGQKNKREGKPPAKRLLRAIAGLEISLVLWQMGEKVWWYLAPLPALLVRVLDLLGLSVSLYTNLVNPCPRPPPADAELRTCSGTC